MGKIKVDKNDETAVVSPEEKIDVSNAKNFKEELITLYEQGFEEIIVDFADVERIQSSGVGALLSFNDKLLKDGGKLKIINVNKDYIKKIFEMTKLHKIIEVEGMN